MKKKSKAKLPAPASQAFALDPGLAQSIVHRRLAMRLGLSLPVAAVVATLAGLGPDAGR